MKRKKLKAQPGQLTPLEPMEGCVPSCRAFPWGGQAGVVLVRVAWQEWLLVAPGEGGGQAQLAGVS